MQNIEKEVIEAQQLSELTTQHHLPGCLRFQVFFRKHKVTMAVSKNSCRIGASGTDISDCFKNLREHLRYHDALYRMRANA